MRAVFSGHHWVERHLRCALVLQIGTVIPTFGGMEGSPLGTSAPGYKAQGWCSMLHKIILTCQTLDTEALAPGVGSRHAGTRLLKGQGVFRTP